MNTPTTPKKIGALYAIDNLRISFMGGESIHIMVLEFEEGKALGEVRLDIVLTKEMRSDLLQMLQDE